ncbi:hypothetical protein E2C01_007247 [Portunus trituberculatus]|uniref:Uncharacterized protein n=1 Tax=Portunus trituberculatus TaxID=210409 RepID=A0A5B7D007_PORTR|nr:hypothetical protein [Portunus trituberculatus]
MLIPVFTDTHLSTSCRLDHMRLIYDGKETLEMYQNIDTFRHSSLIRFISLRRDISVAARQGGASAATHPSAAGWMAARPGWRQPTDPRNVLPRCRPSLVSVLPQCHLKWTLLDPDLFPVRGYDLVICVDVATSALGS